MGMVNAAAGLPNVSASNTRWVPRLGRSVIDVSTSPAHTPLALITARAFTSNDSPVSWSVRRTELPVASEAATLVRMTAPCWAAVLRDGGDQAGVVDQLPVIGQQPTAEAVAPDRGDHVDGPARGDAP